MFGNGLIKSAANHALQLADKLGLIPWSTKPQIHVLNYHAVIPGGTSRIGQPALDGEAFAQQVIYLKRNYRILHASEVADLLQGSSKPYRRSILLTFDDGFANNVTIAQPILEGLGVPAIFFIATRHITPRQFLWVAHARAIFHLYPANRIQLLGKDWDLSSPSARVACFARFAYETRKRRIAETYDALANYPVESFATPDIIEAELRGIHPAEIQRLGASHLISIGAHTRNHPYLTRCSDEELIEELSNVKNELEKLSGKSVEMMAYPDGDYDLRVIQAVRSAGYKAAFRVNTRGCDEYSDFAVPRVGIYHPGKGVLAAKAHGWFHN
jgi:peptidoglycan/xylan/chitin deacetylase (PgdA/CDA1 family)